MNRSELQIKFRQDFFRYLTVVACLIAFSHYLQENYTLFYFTIFNTFCVACLTTKKIFGKYYNILSQVVYSFLILILSFMVAKSGFIASPTMIWIICSAFIVSFIFPRKLALINITYSFLFLIFSFYMSSIGYVFSPMEIKNPNAYKLIAYSANLSFLCYVILTFIKNYQDNLTKYQNQILFNKNLRDVFDNTADYIGIASPETGGVIHNKAFVDITGKDPINREISLTDYHSKEIIDDTLTEAFTVAREKGVWTGESAILDKEGNEIPVIQTIVSHYDEINGKYRTSTIMKDIKEIKDIILEKQKITDMLFRTEKNAKIGSWSLNLKTNELWWSDETYRIHDLPIGTLLNVEKAINFYHPDERDKIRKYIERAISNNIPYEDELRLITTKGEEVWAHVIGRRYTDDKVDILEGSFQDITIQKQAEASKAAFLSMVSHEMRTPLMSIIGFSEVLAETKLSEEQNISVQGIHESGNTLLELINNVLDHAKYKNKKLILDKKSFDLEKFLENQSIITQQLLRDKDVVLTLDYNIKNKDVFGDEHKLKQILNNLLSNSIKFTDQGSISVSVNEKTDYHYEIIVQDTGLGISEDFLPSLFVEFEQDFQSERTHKGTGLGMSITKKLVELFNGSINVESKLNEGTKFIIQIELEPSQIKPPKLAGEVKSTDYNFKNFHIIFADDNAMNRKVVKAMLKSTGVKLTLFEDGDQLLNYYKNGMDADLIITDIQMPNMNGLEATQTIRSFEKENKLTPKPIISFSAYSFDEDIQKALDAGCDDTLSKPVNKANLFEKLNKWLPKN